jgi:hypothetical protein
MISECDLHSQLKYFVCLWDIDHVSQQLAHFNFYGTEQDIVRMIDDTNKKIASNFCESAKVYLQECASKWISPSFCQDVFGSCPPMQCFYYRSSEQA